MSIKNNVEFLSSNYFDETSKNYDKDFSSESIWAIAHELGREYLEGILADSKELVIADIGCGTGKWAKFFEHRAKKVILSDLSKKMLDFASNKFSVKNEIVEASVSDLSEIKSELCDLVLCMGDPLSYVVDYVKAIDELKRITKKNGFIFVSVDSRLGYLRVLKEKHNSNLKMIEDFLETGNIIGWEGLQIHAFTKNELTNLFKKSECQVVDIFSLPTISSYFLFEDSFREQYKDLKNREKILNLEREFLGEDSPGTHHLYALFKRVK